MIKIPIEFNIKVNKINLFLLILDTPSIVTPISSGKGEAIMIAPKSGKKNLKSSFLKISGILLLGEDANINSKFLDILLLTKEKIIKSPITAPNPPKIATVNREVFSAKTPKSTTEGAEVKIEVKNKPAKIIPSHLKPSREAITLKAIPVFMKKIATPILITKRTKSLINCFFDSHIIYIFYLELREKTS